ncbi:MAG: M56 family metallopeptidase, partial [Anaerohalosphaera sp.]|nr:M56 family metallopeptidase [Anaerohalosphaera sp.]
QMTDLNTIFAWLCKSTVQISILILLIVAVRIVLRNKLAARWQYWLWLIVLVRMFMPALPQSSISLFNLLPDTTPVAQTQPETITSPPVTPAPTNTDVTLAPADPQPNPAEVAPIAPAHQLAIQSKPPLNINYTAILLTCWSIGAALLAAHIMLTNFKFWRKVKSLRQLTDNKILDTLEDCKAKMGIETVIGVVVTDAIKSPALFGFLRPRLLLPSDLVDKLTPAQLRHIFFHELAHLKRCDIYISWLTALMQIVHWFNPFVWFAFYQMRADREMACDSLALSMMGNDTPSDYGRTIVSLLENYANREYVPAMAGILESKSNLKQRISMIARFKQGAYKWSPLAAIILVTLCCIGLVDAKRKPAKTPFTKTLANGIQVQLIGVCEHPGKQGQKNRYKNTTWWSPDGNPLDYQLYDHTGGWVAVRDGERGYEFTAKITNAPDDINARMKVIPSGSSVGGGSSRPDMYGSQLKDLRYIGTVLNKDLQTCNVSVGIASGLWQTVAQSRKSKVDGSWGSPSSGTEDGSIAFTKPFETDGKTTITVTHEMNKSDVRLIAVTLDGREHKPTRSSASGGSFTQVTFTYPLKLEHIKSFKLQKRSYQWTKFKNVKLIPDDKKIVKDVTSNQNIMNPKVLNNGISVELLGVCEHPNKKSKHRDSTTDDNYFCWTPDGKLLDGQLYDSPIVKGMNIDEGKRGYEFVARITNAPNDTSAVFDVSPRGSSLATSGLPKFVNDDSQAAGPLKHICYAQTCLDENITTCNVSVGIASGPWQTVSKSIKISNDGKWMSSFGIGNRGAVAFAVPVEMDGETTVSVTHEMGNSDIRMIALDINDKEYRVLRNTSKGNKGFTQLTAIFDIKLDQVKSFVLQERKYQWEKFKNVVLLSKDDLPNGKIMLWVEDFFKNNYKDITARKTIRWADYKQHDNGNQSIRYKYEAEIHNKDKIINNEIFEFDKDGKFVSVKDADAENYVQGWVEDFFANNYRDITARKTISFSDVTEHDNDNVSITYKYEATIRNKDKVINNQIFTFDKNGKFISVEDVASIDLSLPELTAPASSSKRVSYALSKIESLFRRIDSASEEQLLASAGYFDQINEFCDDLQGKNGQTLPRAEWGKLSGADVDSALKIIAQLENTAEGCRDLADGKHTQLLNDHYKTLKKQYTQLCAALRPGSASNTTAANSIEQYLGTWDMVEIRGFAVDHIKSMTVVINSDYTMSFEFPDKEDKSEATKLPWVFENGYLLIDDEYFANLDDGLLRIISGLHSITGDGNVIILKKKTQKPISNAIEPYLGVWNSVEIKGKRVDHMVSYTLTIDPDGTMLAETTDNKGEFHASKGTCIFKNGRLVMEDGGEDIYISLADGLLSLTGEDSKIILKKKTPQIQTYSIEPYLGIWDAVEVKGKDTDEIKTVAVEIYSDNTLSIEFTDNEGIFKAVKRVWTLKDGKMIVNGGDATATLADGLLTMSGDGTTVTLKKRKINSAANSMDPFLGTWTLVDVKGQDSDDIVTLNITITSDGNITIEGTDKKGKNKSETVKYTLRNGRLYIDEDQGLVTLKRDQLILNAGNKIITLKKIASQQSTNAIEPYLGTWHLVEITGKEAKNIVSLSVTI